MKDRPGRLIAVIAVAVGILVVGVILGTLSFGSGDRICRGIAISKVQIGGLSRPQAEARMRAWAQQRLTHKITLVARDRQWSGTLADFGVVVRWKQAVDQAYDVGREGGIFSRVGAMIFGDRRQICADVAFNKAAISKMIRKVAKAVDVPHRDARVKFIDGRMNVTPDASGIKLDEKQAEQDILRAFKCGGPVVNLPVVRDVPDVTAQDIAPINTLLAQYVTSYNPGKADRTQNLNVAAKMIDGMVLKPGQEFSYNKTVGPRLEARGFREAQIFVKGKIEPGLGGGVCQVSSTLYNALLLADLKVVERHHHSRTVPYVVPGRDATVAFGSRDLRFVNSNKSSIAIMAMLKGSQLTINIFGSTSDKKQVQISTSEVKHVAPGVITIMDPRLRPGRRLMLDKGSRGVRVTVYKTLFAADGTKSTVVVSKDRYPRQSAILAIGGKRPVRAAGMRRVEAVHHPRPGVQTRLN